MSGLDFRDLGNPQSRSPDYHASLMGRLGVAMIKTGESPAQRPVRDYNFYKLELQ